MPFVEDSLISPRPRLELARCPLIPNELLLCCASLNSLFFRIIGVSLSGTGTTDSVLNPSIPIPLIDFLVFLTNPVVSGGPIVAIDRLGPPGGCLGGEDGRGPVGLGREESAKVRNSTGGIDDASVLPNCPKALSVELPFEPSPCFRFGSCVGEVDTRSRIARVDSLLRAIFRSDGGGGRSIGSSSSSGGVSGECNTIGCGLNAATLFNHPQ